MRFGYMLNRFLYGLLMQIAFIALALDSYKLIFLKDIKLHFGFPILGIPMSVAFIVCSYYVLTRIYPYREE